MAVLKPQKLHRCRNDYVQAKQVIQRLPFLHLFLYMTSIGANCPGTSGTVTELLVTSLVPHGSLPCPGYSTVYLVYRRRSGNEGAKWRRKECHFDCHFDWS